MRESILSSGRAVRVGAAALAGLLLVGLLVNRILDASTAADIESPVVIAGVGNHTSDHFHLSGGTYRSVWSAWGQTPVDPPCTHSASLLAVDPSNATTPAGHVVDLAQGVQVPSTGTTTETYLINVKPGDYYLDVTSACAWQFSFSPNR